MSKYSIVELLISALNCSELAIGDIKINDDHSVVEVHNKHASLALRSLNSNKLDASIIEG